MTVRKILSDVKTSGDSAVRKYSLEFDGQYKGELGKAEIRAAYRKVPDEVISALRKAAGFIRAFAEKQISQIMDFEINVAGAILGQRAVPIERVGCYVPGGRFPLPSSALMGVIPAKVAGVKEVVVCSPKIQPVTIVAADIAGADRIFGIGGVQAIGAMAYGTETVPKADKIVGPGNRYVAEAKKEVFGTVGIDFIAGPSEILIIADEAARPEIIAADLAAQLEHDPDAAAELITTSKELAARIRELGFGATVVTNLDEAVDLSNLRAPEHLELMLGNPGKIIPKLRNYGALFIGEKSAVAFGDYCGPNHILPTGGAACYTGGLSVLDFVKIVSFQRVEDAGEMVEVAGRLADAEGLKAHKKSAEIRKSI
ncbi:MAG: histidinol dehydrogenase [archaeon]